MPEKAHHSVPARTDVAVGASRAPPCSCPMRECGAVRQTRSVTVRNSWSDPASALGCSDFSIRENWWWSQGKEKWLSCYPSPTALALTRDLRPYGRPWRGWGKSAGSSGAEASCLLPFQPMWIKDARTFGRRIKPIPRARVFREPPEPDLPTTRCASVTSLPPSSRK